MSRVKHGIAIGCLLFLLCVLAACAAREPFAAGKPLTAGEVSDLRTELLEQKGDVGGKADNEIVNDDAAQNATVYWLPNGSVYHTDGSCYHIKEKPNVQSGTVAAATGAGKTRPCSACTGD